MIYTYNKITKSGRVYYNFIPSNIPDNYEIVSEEEYNSLVEKESDIFNINNNLTSEELSTEEESF